MSKTATPGMSKTALLRALRIDFDKESGFYMVCVGSGLTYRAFSSCWTEGGAKRVRAEIRRSPAAYGID